MESSFPFEVEQLLQDLQNEQSFIVKEEALKNLAELETSDRRVIEALIAVTKSDPTFLIRKRAQDTLRAPAHQKILAQHPDLRASLEMQDFVRRPPSPKARVSAERPQAPKPDAGSQALLDHPQQRQRGSRGIGNILVGFVFIVGGLSGKLVLRGTNNSELLVLLGVGLLMWGLYKATNPE